MKLFKSALASGVASLSILISTGVFAENLFSPIEQSDMQQALTLEYDPSQISVKHYQMKTDLVDLDAATLTFNLDENLMFKVNKEEASFTPQGSLLWQGSADKAFSALQDIGSPSDDSATLVKTDKGITGTLRVNGRLFKISPAGKGVHKVIEVDEASMPDDHPAGAMENIDVEHALSSKALQSHDLSANIQAAAPADIRVLVAYTEKARRRAGDIRGTIELAVAESNQGFRNSGINASMTLAHAYEVNYQESNDMGRDLDAIEGRNDGRMDEVHSRRDQYNADMVLFVTDTDDGCGLASGIGSSAATAFAVVRVNCATGYYSFGHEAGHLLSARHDPDTDGSTRPYAYGHGFRYAPGNWRTIMAYSCSGGCTRINWWSNPDKRRGGVAMGTTSRSDNARVINITAPTVAAFRSGGGTTPPPSGGFNGRVNLPGRVQAENYYQAPVETTNGNLNTASITKCTYYGLGVDVQNSSGSTCNVGWTAAGEKLTYRVGNAGGRYNLGVRLASTQNGRRVRVEVNGNNAGTVSTSGNGWQSYTTETINNVSVPNNATITVTFIDGNANLDFINFSRAGSNPTPTPAPTRTPSPTATPTPPSGNCTAVALRERKEVSLQSSNCVTFNGSLAGRTLAVWDSDTNSSCDFRGSITSVDGNGRLAVDANYKSSTSFTGRTIRFDSSNGCRFLKVRYY